MPVGALATLAGPADTAEVCRAVARVARRAPTAVLVYLVGAVDQMPPGAAGVGVGAQMVSSVLAVLGSMDVSRSLLVVDTFGGAPGLEDNDNESAAGRGRTELLVSRAASAERFAAAALTPLTAELRHLLVNGDPASGANLTLGGVNRRLADMLAERGQVAATLAPAAWSDDLILARNAAHTPPLLVQEAPATRILPDFESPGGPGTIPLTPPPP
ncbi:hypothetical protein, partial [Frankia canadensis]|uniref:hypothetical protein n=1 Tax=Frankia canadensis TaxID=1836972 RepID=UPI00105692DD